MEVFDCNKYFNKNKTDVFQSISPEDLQSLHMEAQERQGIFKPITTDTHHPIRAALIAINGFADVDFREFFANPNPMVVACREHKSLVEKLPPVIEKYRSGVPELASGAFYFTNFVKVYPPRSEFTKANQMNKLLKNCPHLTNLFRQYLTNEIIGLVRDGCRIFICFGNDAARYFNETLHNDFNVQCQTVGTFGTSNMVRRCTIKGEDVFVVSERHYTYYAKATTNYLVSVLAEACDK